MSSLFASSRGPVVVAPRVILADGSLTASEKLVLFCLFSYADKHTGVASVARTQIARETDLAASTISKLVASLETKNWLTRKVTCVKGGVRRPNIFLLKIPVEVVPAAPVLNNPLPKARKSPSAPVPAPAASREAALERIPFDFSSPASAAATVRAVYSILGNESDAWSYLNRRLGYDRITASMALDAYRDEEREIAHDARCVSHAVANFSVDYGIPESDVPAKLQTLVPPFSSAADEYLSALRPCLRPIALSLLDMPADYHIADQLGGGEVWNHLSPVQFSRIDHTLDSDGRYLAVFVE